MTKQFTNNDVYKDEKTISLKNHQFNRSDRGPADSSLDDMNFFLNTTPPTQEEFDEIMRQTNCPFCHLPKTHCNNHFLSACTKMKKYGYKHKYDQITNET